MNNLNDVITWLAAGGAVAAAAWFASWFLEALPWWQRLTSQAKSLSILGLATGLGLAATGIQALPPESLQAITPYANTLILTIVAWLGSQVAHRSDRVSRERSEAHES